MCVLPWVNLHVATTGAISPCCEFRGEVANLSTATLQEAWRSSKLETLRSLFLKGVPLKACLKCVDREASEGKSLRLSANKRFAGKLREIEESVDPLHSTGDFPTALDLRFSNLCNFKCRSCWHGASSKWFSDGKAIGLTVGNKGEISSFESVDHFMSQIEGGLPRIEYIYFAGGEPLLQPEHYAVLERLISLGRTDLTLAYNTNLSVMASKDISIFDLWSRFRDVKVDASVDAAGELGAIVRKGFDWSVFVTNVKTLRERCPHVRIRFGITVSIMNILALPDLFNALHRECSAQAGDLNLHSLQDPIVYRTQVLSLDLKAKAANQLRDFMASLSDGHMGGEDATRKLERQLTGPINYMNAKDLSGFLPRYAQRTAQLDALRGDTGVRDFPAIPTHYARPKAP